MFRRSASERDGGDFNMQDELCEGTCTAFLGCFFENKKVSEHHKELLAKKRAAAATRPDDFSPPIRDPVTCSDQELLDDLELVLEGRGLISTIFLPSKASSLGSSSSVPRTAFIRCKSGDSKIECQVVIDNTVVSNGTLKRFKFSAFDVSKVSKGRDKNSLIPTVVDDSLVMRFTILKKGELHFVFESQRVRDDIVQGFKLFISKKKSTVNHPMPKLDHMNSISSMMESSEEVKEESPSPEASNPGSPSDTCSSTAFFPCDSSNRLLPKTVGYQ